MFGSGLPGTLHSDVLNAAPATDDEKVALVEEIKRRAKGSVAARNYPEAIQLYTKAIELRPSDHVLYSNRSMCHLSMGNNEKALEDANQSLYYDITYAKGYYRKGAALFAMGDLKLAFDAFLSGNHIAPKDRDMRKQLDKIEKLLEEQKKAEAEKKDNPPESETLDPSQKMPEKKKNEKPIHETPESEPMDCEEDDGEIVVNNTEELRGYKKTADGKLTTYFNKELDEHAKTLIGDITPKKIEVDSTNGSASSATVAANNSSAPIGTSVWNSAGTYEERIHTPWAKERLTQLISAIHITPYSSAEYDISVRVKAVSAIDGDAQISMVRNKRKHIYDFKVDIDWELDHLAKGT